MVDEGALAGGSGQHTAHGTSDTGSFTVQLNGEDGVITLGYGDQKVELKVENGQFSKPEPATITVNGVEVKVTGATQNEDGSWQVNYSYALQGNQPHDDAASSDYHTDELQGTITVDVVDATGDSAVQGSITVEVHDDGPIISTSDISTSVVPGDSGDNLADGTKVSFTTGNREQDKLLAGTTIAQGTELDGWDGVTIYAGKVTYITDADGNTVIAEDGLDIDAGYKLQYSTYPNYNDKPASDWGLMVSSKEDAQDWEINVSKDGTTSEAVVFDLGGQLAYGVTIDFGAFYLGGEAAQYDHVSEKALVTFYRNGEIVGSTLVQGQSSDGKFTLNSSDVVLGGFDKVVISAVDNTTNEYGDELSDFTIQGIDFITKRDDPIIVSEGTVTAESGADGFADAYADINAQFDLAGMVNEGTLSEDGTSGTITVLVDGVEHTVTLSVSTGSSGDSILTGTLSGGDQLFTATLDKNGNWTMEQYEQFRVDDGTPTGSKQFELVFKTEDADGDIAGTTVNVPLEVVNQTINVDNEVIDNSDDTIVINDGDGIAGTVAAGDSGGMTEGQQVAANYNVCFILDTSGSMDEKVGGNGTDRNDSRLEVAVESIENFINTSIHQGDFVGTVNLAVVTFESRYGETIDVSITRVSDGQGGYTETYTLAGKTYNSYEAFKSDFHDRLDNLNATGGTNYQAGFHNAAEWFDELGDTSKADGNITYFLSDGVPTYHGTNTSGGGSYATKGDVQGAWTGYQELLGAASGMQVNAIGFGTDLDDNAMKTLAMLDNTGTPVSGVEGNQAADGYLYYGSSGQMAWQPVKEVYTAYEEEPSRRDDNTYYTQLEDGSYQELVWENQGNFWNPDYQLGYYTDRVWHEVTDNLYTMEEVPVIATGGNATQVTDGEGLSAAFESGFKPGALVAAGDDTITAEDSDSSVIVYGDVMNTDSLLHDLVQNTEISGMVAAGAIASLPGYGSGAEVFQWLEENGAKLTGTDYVGWTHTDTVDYMLEHAEELGYETRVDEDGHFYLVNANGDVLNMNGAEADGVALDSLTGRGGGDDVITGSTAHDFIFGQEGNDLIVGDGSAPTLGDAHDADSLATAIKALGQNTSSSEFQAFLASVEGSDADGNDQLFGGSGNDVIFGMGGDDYIVGGAGEDMLFGGSGNDIIVYDKNDYLVDGGSGIDVMVYDGTLSMSELLKGDGTDAPIVHGVEVLITGSDALSLTSMDQLARDYGVTINAADNTLTLDRTKWEQNSETGTFDYIGQNDVDLTLETNLPSATSTTADADAQTQVFILNNSNGG